MPPKNLWGSFGNVSMQVGDKVYHNVKLESVEVSYKDQPQEENPFRFAGVARSGSMTIEGDFTALNPYFFGMDEAKEPEPQSNVEAKNRLDEEY